VLSGSFDSDYTQKCSFLALGWQFYWRIMNCICDAMLEKTFSCVYWWSCNYRPSILNIVPKWALISNMEEGVHFINFGKDLEMGNI
jgi:hypothetical protein